MIAWNCLFPKTLWQNVALDTLLGIINTTKWNILHFAYWNWGSWGTKKNICIRIDNENCLEIFINYRRTFVMAVISGHWNNADHNVVLLVESIMVFRQWLVGYGIYIYGIFGIRSHMYLVAWFGCMFRACRYKLLQHYKDTDKYRLTDTTH